MSNFPSDTKPESWHRYFAVECNNKAWELATTPQSKDAQQEMLNCAHASAFHWQVVGNELNHMRAKTLLAETHALLGLGASAFQYAEEIYSYFLDRDTEDWELAYIHTIHAHAAAVSGRTEVHRKSYAHAIRALEQIEDAEDRRIVQQTFDQVPTP